MKKTYLYLFFIFSIIAQGFSAVIARENSSQGANPKVIVSIGTFNLKNFNFKSIKDDDRKRWIQYMGSLSFDILAVQEVLDPNSLEEMVSTTHPNYSIRLSTKGGFGEQKLGFVYNPKLYSIVEFKEIIGQENFSNLRPFVLALFKNLKTQELIPLITVHLKAGGKNANRAKRVEQLEYLDKLFTNDFKNAIVLGDFNSTHWGRKDSNVKKWSHENKMHGTAPAVGCTTFFRKGKGPMLEPSLLDHVFVHEDYQLQSAFVFGPCKKFQCIPTPADELEKSEYNLSDHCPIVSQLTKVHRL